MRVVICGGGVIGAAIAYFLSVRGVQPLVVERTRLACGASGKSGGFLALDWCDGTPLEPLARRSFHLHGQLSEEIGGDWGYRRLTTYGATLAPGASSHSSQGADASWLSDRGTGRHRLGTPDTTAQVHPERFTEAVMRAAIDRGPSFAWGR